MGRRAKNKQSDPELLEPKVFPTSKKLGKRKADSDHVDHGKGNSRPTKKMKELNGKQKQKSPSKGKKKTVEVLSDEDEELEGWEDVEDGVDLKTLTKLGIYFFPLNLGFNDYFSLPDLYLMAVMMMVVLMFSRVVSMISKQMGKSLALFHKT